MLLCLPFYLCICATHCFTIFDLYWSWSSWRVVSQKCASNSAICIHDFFLFFWGAMYLFFCLPYYVILTTGNALITVRLSPLGIISVYHCFGDQVLIYFSIQTEQNFVFSFKLTQNLTFFDQPWHCQ